MQKIVIVALIGANLVLGFFALPIFVSGMGLGGGYSQNLGSSFFERVDFKDENQRQAAAKIISESCGTSVSSDSYDSFMSSAKSSATSCVMPASGIKFVGEGDKDSNAQEMSLLVNRMWDKRTLLVTYYLLQRGFDETSQNGLDIDCDIDGFSPLPKMTLGVHYDKIGSYVDKSGNPVESMQYVSTTNKTFSPEGKLDGINSISPHAYGQAVDIYSFGCSVVYDILQSDPATSLISGGTVPPHIIYQKIGIFSNFVGSYATFNEAIKNSSGSSLGNSAGLSEQVDQNEFKSLLGTITEQVGCDTQAAPGYINLGCIARTQTKSYKTPSYVGSKLPPSNEIAPVQYITGSQTPPPLVDSVEYTDKKSLLKNYLPFQKQADTEILNTKNFVKSESDQKSFLANQRQSITDIIAEASLLFSQASQDNQEQLTGKVWQSLTKLALPDRNNIINQLATILNINANILKSSTDIYGKESSDQAQLAKGRSRGIGINSVQSDRIHIGF